jgi:hypothetical protein
MLVAENAMKGTAATLASCRTCSGEGDVAMAGQTTRISLIAVVAAAFFTLSVQAVLAFQKYRFNNGLMLGTAMAALNWYEHTAPRNGLPRSRVNLILIAASAAAFTVTLQQAAWVLAAGLAQVITHS